MKTVIYKYITSKKFNIIYKRYLGSLDVYKNIITTVGGPGLGVRFDTDREALDFIAKHKTLKYFLLEHFNPSQDEKTN